MRASFFATIDFMNHQKFSGKIFRYPIKSNEICVEVNSLREKETDKFRYSI